MKNPNLAGLASARGGRRLGILLKLAASGLMSLWWQVRHPRAAPVILIASTPRRSELSSAKGDATTPYHCQFEAGRVEAFRLTRLGLCALGALAATMALMVAAFLLPLDGTSLDVSPNAIQAFIIGEAKKLSGDLQEFEEIARQEQDRDLARLVNELKAKIEEMRQPCVDVDEALSKLSEMQAAISTQQAQFNTGLVDGQLQALGDALAGAAATEGAGKALLEGQYDRASEELVKLADREFQCMEARVIEERLKQIGKNASDVGLELLSEAAGDLAQGVSGSRCQLRRGATTLAKAAQHQARRKKINTLLEAQFARLSECKLTCECSGGPQVRSVQKTLGQSSS